MYGDIWYLVFFNERKKLICSRLTREQSNALYVSVIETKDTEALRKLCLTDLFFLLTVACKRKDIDRDWLYDRCREVESYPDGYLDLWSREHYKSTIITFGLTIQDILNNPEETFGIFSHTRPIAKAFLAQIKREFEENKFLKELFPEILYENPKKSAAKWSLDDGIIVKRKSNPKESTIEAWGLVDGQPTSKHYSKLVYDDVVTIASVTSPEMIKKVTDAFGISLNLGAEGGAKRYIGTRYHQNDTYSVIMERGTAKERIYPATDNGKLSGKPVFFSEDTLREKIRDMGSYVASCQLLQNPLEDNAMGFSNDWLEYYNIIHKSAFLNYYILVDPAGEKKKENDFTVITVWGLAEDQNYYLVDGIRDRLNLTERTKQVFRLVRKWNPLNTGYEKYGMQSDVEHIKYVQEQEGFRFRITELGGAMPKNDRIRRLVPLFENHRIYFPHRIMFVTAEGKSADFIYDLMNYEYTSFPVSTHDDMLDCMARIVDPKLDAQFPAKKDRQKGDQNKYDPLGMSNFKQPSEEYNPLAFSSS